MSLQLLLTSVSTSGIFSFLFFLFCNPEVEEADVTSVGSASVEVACSDRSEEPMRLTGSGHISGITKGREVGQVDPCTMIVHTLELIEVFAQSNFSADKKLTAKKLTQSDGTWIVSLLWGEGAKWVLQILAPEVPRRSTSVWIAVAMSCGAA